MTFNLIAIKRYAGLRCETPHSLLFNLNLVTITSCHTLNNQKIRVIFGTSENSDRVLQWWLILEA